MEGLIMSHSLFYLDHVYESLSRELKTKEEEYKQLPKGSLYFKPRHTGKSLCWKRSSLQNKSGKRKEIILKDDNPADQAIAKGVRRRFFLSTQMERIKKNLTLIDECRKNYLLCDDEVISSLLPDTYKLPTSNIPHEFDNLSKHSGTEQFFPNSLIHKNSMGEYFRSKSEVQISELLHNLHIPYQYELPLTLGGKTIYPDFTIIHPTTGATLYIEYFGMVDSREYGLRMLEKIELYLNNHLIPGVDVLFLFETSSSGMDLVAIQKSIKQLIQ